MGFAYLFQMSKWMDIMHLHTTKGHQRPHQGHWETRDGHHLKVISHKIYGKPS